MYKELCSVIAFYLCDFTLNYLRYGNYKSYQCVTSACPTGAVSKADWKMRPILSSRGIISQLEGRTHHVCSGLFPGRCSAQERRLSPKEHTSLFGIAMVHTLLSIYNKPRNQGGDWRGVSRGFGETPALQWSPLMGPPVFVEKNISITVGLFNT